MIIIFGKEYCPYCKNSKKILSESNNEFKYFPLEETQNQELVEQLRTLELIPESHHTVPIVINYKDRKPIFIGGNDDLVNFLG
tara:strand:- start:45 stop:293 length:249 start_codon:yes stop_codon:yes gene_type:complete